MATASLTGLPLELLVHLIATYLPTKDLGALRLTNKYLEKALFDAFAKEFFTKKQFMLSTSSLQALVDISKHRALNKILKHVVIGLESFQATARWMLSNRTDAQREAFRDGYADQYALMSSGRGRSLLAEALRNLPNLDTVGIRDYEAYGRVRDDDLWRGYGARTMSRQIGFNLSAGSSELASPAFLLLMQALADADRAIPSIEVILRTQQTGLMASAFFLPPPNTKMGAVLSGLRRLLLTLDLNTHPAYELTASPSYITSFLIETSSLNHLRLNIHKDNFPATHSLLQGLTTTPNLLPDLRRLDLGMMSISPEILIQTISRFSATLNHVSLWKIELRYDGAALWKDFEDRFNPWPRVLRHLSTMTGLTHISLGCLAQQNGLQPIIVKFSDGKILQECSGDLRTCVPKLIDQMVISWPQPPESSDSEFVSDEELVESEDGDTDEDGDESYGS